MANLTTLASFNNINGDYPAGRLIADANGNLFGTTVQGGTDSDGSVSNDGVVFELAKTANGYASTPTVVFNFSDGLNDFFFSADGQNPVSGLIADSNGNLFGTTLSGGSSGPGVVFEIANPEDGYGSTFTVLASFNPEGPAEPHGELIEDANGDLFGTTFHGGAGNHGTVFEIAKTAGGYASTATILVNFNYFPDGDDPSAGLITDASGNLFSTTLAGGASDDGTVFEIAKTTDGYASTPTTLVSFNGIDGNELYAGLIADANGDLFGTTDLGGPSNDGTVFEIAKTVDGYASAPITLVTFDSTDGAVPFGDLIADADGNLFGTTNKGGSSNNGTVFEIAKTPGGYANTPTTLVSFNSTDGAGPVAGLIADTSGDLFGTTSGGGATGNGTIFEVTNTGYVVACFCTGTMILTAQGDVAVENLAVADAVVTASGALAPVRWVGRRHIDLAVAANRAAIQPLRVTAHAFGPGLPKRDLLLSPDHAVFVEGVLVPVKHFINGATITQAVCDEVTYWHVELERHDIILAAGLPCESYLDTGNRRGFADGVIVGLHPSFAPGEGSEAMWEAAGCAPLRIEGSAIDRVVARLRERAAELGYLVETKPQLPHRRCLTETADLADLLAPDWYLDTNPDVVPAGVDARTHYVEWAGRREGRRPCPEVDLVRALGLVDPGTVAIVMPDVIAAGVDPVDHFCKIGWIERRSPNPYFDTGWYLDTHDVPSGMNPLLHYLLLGENQGLFPSRHFNPAWYRQHYAIRNTVSPLAHYLMHRRTQRFSPNPSFDVFAYRQMHAASLLPKRDPYAHFLAIGRFDLATVTVACELVAA